MRPIDFLEILKNGFRTRLLAQANSDIDISLPSSPGTLSRIEDLRPKATSQPIFYVSTTGSDSNDGLTVGTAFATLQKAIDVLSTIDCNGFNPRIILATPGTYVQPAITGLVLKNLVGVGTHCSIEGDVANPQNYKIQCTGPSNNFEISAIRQDSTTLYRLEGVEIGCATFDSNYPKYIKASTKLILDRCGIRGNGNTHDGVVMYGSGNVIFQRSLQLNGTFRWVTDSVGGFLHFEAFSPSTFGFTTASGCQFTVFSNAVNTSILAFNTTHTGSGTFVGKRFEIIDGYVETYNTGAGLPGDTAGTDARFTGASGVTDGDKGDIVVSASGSVWSIDDGVIDNDNIASNAGIEWSKISKTGAAAGDVGAIASTQLGANNGVAQLGTTGKHLPGQSLPSSVTYTSSTGVFDFTWADNSTQSINLPIENLFQNASYNASTQTLTLTTNGGGTLDISLATLVDLPEIVVSQSDPATTPTTGQRLYLRSDTGEYWITASGSWQGKYLAFTAAERSKLAGIETGAINQTTADGLYRQLSSNIPANEITGTFADNQIPSSIARDTEVAAAVAAHEAAADPHPGYRLESAAISTSEVTDLAEFVRDTIGTTLVQGSNVTIAVDDPANTITISATSGSGGGFTPVIGEYETPGTSALFSAPTGATRLYSRVIAAGAGGGSGRRGAAGTQRGGGGGGQGGGWSETTLTLAGIAASLSTTVDNLRFSVVVQAGGPGGASVTTDDTSGNNGTAPSGETQLRVQAGTGGTPVVICRAQSQGAGIGGSLTGGATGFSLSLNASNTMAMFASPGATAGGTGGSTSGFQSTWATGIQGGSGGQGINSSNVGASAFGFGQGGTMNAMGGGIIPLSTAGNNAVAHGIPFLAGNAGIGGSSNGTTSRNGGNGYRGSGGGGGGASENGTASGAGGTGGNGYVAILWM